jgi:hypothetical protein
MADAVSDRDAAHLKSAARAGCMGGGCLARRACPVGAEHARTRSRLLHHASNLAGERAGWQGGVTRVGSMCAAAKLIPPPPPNRWIGEAR